MGLTRASWVCTWIAALIGQSSFLALALRATRPTSLHLKEANQQSLPLGLLKAILPHGVPNPIMPAPAMLFFFFLFVFFFSHLEADPHTQPVAFCLLNTGTLILKPFASALDELNLIDLHLSGRFL